jgi:hypothetical protein
VGSLCREVWIANTVEHAQVLIQAGDVDRLTRGAIQQVHSGVECFSPVASCHRGLK